MFVRIAEDRAYVAVKDSGIVIIDVSEPTEPLLLGQFETHQKTYEIHAVRDMVHARIRDQNRTQRILIIDANDPQQPKLVGSYGEAVYGYNVRGDTGFVISDRYVLSIFDLTDPAEPELLSTLEDVPGKSIEFINEIAVVACGRRLLEIDISDLNNPVVLYDRHADIPGCRIYRIALTERNIYGVGGAPRSYYGLEGSPAGLTIVRLQSRINFYELDMYRTEGQAIDIEIAGDYAFVANQKDGLEIIDISDVLNPVKAANLDVNAAAIDIVDDLCFVGTINELVILNIVNPESPEELSRMRMPDNLCVWGLSA